jgi:hypothetical protein
MKNGLKRLSNLGQKWSLAYKNHELSTYDRFKNQSNHFF